METEQPLFLNPFLSVSLVFCMRRPLSHFVGRNHETGELSSTAPSALSAIRSDVDKLAKFVLDSLNGVIYNDDRQVMHSVSIKVLESHADCLGSTNVSFRVFSNEDVNRISQKHLCHEC